MTIGMLFKRWKSGLDYVAHSHPLFKKLVVGQVPHASASETCATINQAARFLVPFFFVLFCFCHQQKFKSPTAVSRLDLLHALVEKNTFKIDAYERTTTDKAVYDGHVYSDKAPGTAFLALPFFYLASGLLSLAGTRLDSEEGWFFSSWFCCVGALAAVTAVGGACLFRWLCYWSPPRIALLTTVSLFLGGLPLPYTTLLFSHSLVVGLLSIALWAIAWTPQPGYVGIRPMYGFLAGFCCGFALASEYTAGLIIAGLTLGVLRTSANHVGTYILGAIPPLLLIPGYSWACFGDPMVLPYSLDAFSEMRQGLYAIKWPDLCTGLKLLFSPARGLLFWSPFLALTALGYPELFRKSKLLFLLAFVPPLFHFVIISGRVWDWPAGPAFGPRFLAPILPLISLPCALGMQRCPRIGLALACYSVAVTTFVTLTDACPDFSSHPNPLLDLNLPLFLRGQISPNLGTAAGLPVYLSVALYYILLIVGACWLWRRLPDIRDRLK